jgi:redox-sensitive bicupin YhaK (pirin superfamily)
MDRKKFLRNSLLGFAGLAFGRKESAGKTLIKQSKEALVGFNHLPGNENIKMNYVIHRAESRGHANHGWLDSHHSFSFAGYYNPERMNFGVLRVLNDDIVEGGKGFGTHPHDNMEIISIPLEGDLEHKDSMGNVAVIRKGDIQVMSAGTGIRHSEYNKNQDKPVKFLQIWIYPRVKNLEPRYDQVKIDHSVNSFNQILSPNPEDKGVWIHQDAWFYMGDFNKNRTENYKFHKSTNGAYIFMIDGSAKIAGEALKVRDAIGIWDAESVEIQAEAGARILLMEVPMHG